MLNLEVDEPMALIVDDETISLSVLENFCLKVGLVRLKKARNGQDAVNIFKELLEKNKRVSVITMDLEMPVLGGKEAITMIRELEKLHHV
mmetsp:Transcript_11827/g.10231  ORF Transcript_11827/g.10231 Transcript_11827/m.10231 type:complete len:90 (-) Transcript_11827:165-434(-)